MPGQSSLNAAPVDTFGDPAGQAASPMRAGQAGLTGLAGDSMAMSQNAQKLYGQYSQQFLKDFGLMFQSSADRAFPGCAVVVGFKNVCPDGLGAAGTDYARRTRR
ncbi:hypothetical protein Desaf_1133 [Desulfocurvibacter africanus subsp. africanus str. Walvis Bay]|uniref:Uncharacterized protein n=1 Tax=Desulfocurvibacter africanus subsp. africanus str. Walvis Bay TaxID=690850 RepID=F3YXN2_DESAF|nr:hypothetical protein Desaf_1133 [Desulfocurvibacter africanus subsp. africanus str. Walvis Bay]